MVNDRLLGILNKSLNRRVFIQASAAGSLSLTLSRNTTAAMRNLDKPVRIGVIADLHHDVMHDGIQRMRAFVKKMENVEPDALLQLGDFAYPNAKNRGVIELFNRAHQQTLHVIGNHDTDSGHTKQQCLDLWGMPKRYYTQNIEGLQLVVLDGNDKGSPTHKGGYPSFVGKEQVAWLKEQLATLSGPMMVVCHQPLAGVAAVDNADEIQTLLAASADKVVLVINGHSHIDDVLQVKNVTYMHVNSASYKWVGGDYQHESYSQQIHKEYPWISYTCPYRDSLFATLTFDPQTLSIRVEGRDSEWVGKTPKQLGVKLDPKLTHGEEVSPVIRDRRLTRNAK